MPYSFLVIEGLHTCREKTCGMARQQNQSTRVNIQWFVRIMCADTWIIECANPFDKPLFLKKNLFSATLKIKTINNMDHI